MGRRRLQPTSVQPSHAGCTPFRQCLPAFWKQARTRLEPHAPWLGAMSRSPKGERLQARVLDRSSHGELSGWMRRYSYLRIGSPSAWGSRSRTPRNRQFPMTSSRSEGYSVCNPGRPGMGSGVHFAFEHPAAPMAAAPLRAVGRSEGAGSLVCRMGSGLGVRNERNRRCDRVPLCAPWSPWCSSLIDASVYEEGTGNQTTVIKTNEEAASASRPKLEVVYN
jgi:hypothetical protein